jgi:hypothetical protein
MVCDDIPHRQMILTCSNQSRLAVLKRNLDASASEGYPTKQRRLSLLNFQTVARRPTDTVRKSFAEIPDNETFLCIARDRLHTKTQLSVPFLSIRQ